MPTTCFSIVEIQGIPQGLGENPAASGHITRASNTREDMKDFLGAFMTQAVREEEKHPSETTAVQRSAQFKH